MADAEPADFAAADVRQLHRGGEQDGGGDDGRRGPRVAGRHARPQGQALLLHGAAQTTQEEGEQSMKEGEAQTWSLAHTGVG